MHPKYSTIAPAHATARRNGFRLPLCASGHISKDTAVSPDARASLSKRLIIRRGGMR